MKISVETIDHEIHELLENKPMTCDNLEKFVLLNEAKKYMTGETAPAEFNEAEAKKWVDHMDPPARWTMEQTTSVMRQHGWDHRPCEFYAIMNSLVSDYGATMVKHGVDRTDLWADLAHDWLKDADAVRDKAAKYWKNIVRHM